MFKALYHEHWQCVELARTAIWKVTAHSLQEPGVTGHYIQFVCLLSLMPCSNHVQDSIVLWLRTLLFEYNLNIYKNKYIRTNIRQPLIFEPVMGIIFVNVFACKHCFQFRFLGFFTPGEVVNHKLISRQVIWAPVGDVSVLVSTYFVYQNNGRANTYNNYAWGVWKLHSRPSEKQRVVLLWVPKGTGKNHD